MPSNTFEEQKIHSTMFVPYSFYRGIMPDYYPQIGKHRHREFELFLMLEGNCFFTVDNQSFTANAGDIILVQPNVLHSAKPLKNGRAIYHIIVFNQRILCEHTDDRLYIEIFESIISGKHKVRSPIVPGDMHYAAIRDAAEIAINCACENHAFGDLIMKSELLKLFALLSDGGHITEFSEQESEISGAFAPVVQFIRENYEQNISIELLAEKAHLSKSYFMGRFRKVMGISAMEYVDRIRMEHVCNFLRTTNDTITDIAFRCGFNNIANFNRHFRKAMGTTPNQYRKTSNQLHNGHGKKLPLTKSIYSVKFSVFYHDALKKAVRCKKTADQLHCLICQFTGYSYDELLKIIDSDVGYQQFLEEAPCLFNDREQICGVYRGMRVDKIQEPMMKLICQFEKYITDALRKKV